MKRIVLALLLLQCLLANAQVNYCNRLDELTKSSSLNHFSDLIKYNNKDPQNSNRYMTNVSFLIDDVGYIYAEPGKEAAYICRTVQNTPQEVEKFDNSVWACLLLQPNVNWQRREENNNIYYDNRTNGVQITLFNSQGWLFIQIQYNPVLLVPVLSDHFCNEVDTIVNAFTNNFSNLKGVLIESKDGKKVYRSKIHLNHKLNYSDITESPGNVSGVFLYEYSVYFSGFDCTLDALIKRLDNCLLTGKNGWTKAPPKITIPSTGSGIITYQKNKLTLTVYHTKLKATEPEDLVIKVNNTQ